MQRLQDIDIGTKNQSQLRIQLQDDAGGIYRVSLQELGRHPPLVGVYSELLPPIRTFSSAHDAFRYGVQAIRTLLNSSSDDIDVVNNPCNEELLKADVQSTILNSYGLRIAVTVNL